MKMFLVTGLILAGISFAKAGKLGPLVSTEWLAQHQDDPQVRIIQVDDVTAVQYPFAHIAGAVGIVLQTDLESPVRRDFADIDVLIPLLEKLGASSDQTIVLYDAGGVPVGGLPSIYAYWVLRYRGAKNIKVLEGGLAKWVAEGRPVTKKVPTYPAGKFAFSGTRPSLRIQRDGVLSRLGTKEIKLIDCRTAAEFEGKAPAPPGKPDVVTVTGHIPTAKHILWSRALTPQGTFKAKRHLESLYHGYTRRSRKPIATYCLRGERGVVTWFVLHELLGQHNVRLYDGSWTEWGNLVDVPVVNESAK